MAFAGDSSGIGLPDVFQSLEANRKTGLLVVTPEEGGPPWSLAFKEGAVAAVGRPGVATPAEVMVRWGYVEPDAAEEAGRRLRRGRGKKTLGEVLASAEILDRETYQGLVARIVEEEVLGCLAVDRAAFSFQEGEPEWDGFDAEQLWADLALPVGPLLLEAARRLDEWARIRRNIGSDHEVFLALGQDDQEPADPAEATVLCALDGESDVADLLEALPFTRFELMRALSSLVEAGRARSAGPEELCRLAESDLSAGQEDRAVRRLRAALEIHRHDPVLRRRLAETLIARGEGQEAAAELALAAQDLEAAGSEEEARELLGQAVELRPAEPALRARLLLLTFKAGDLEEVKVQGMDLARLYLSLGLAEKARKILVRLLKEPGLQEDQEILLDLAQVETRAGRMKEATAVYLHLAGQAARAGREGTAAGFLEQILALDPECGDARKGLAELRTGASRRRRRLRARLLRIVLAAGVLCLAFILAMHELTARLSLARVHVIALEETLWGRPAVAIPAVRALVAGHPWTFAAGEAHDLLEHLAELQLERARSLLAEERMGEAALALVHLKEQGGDLVSRAAWWPLLGALIRQAATGALTDAERALIGRHLGRITGLARADLVEWRLWWIRSGAEFLPGPEGRESLLAPRAPRQAGPPE